VIQKRLLAGLFSLLPLGVTIWALKIVFNVLIGLFRSPLNWTAAKLGFDSPPGYWPLAAFSLLTLALLLFAVGTLVQKHMGRQLLGWFEGLIMNIPWIKGLYGALKQVTDAFQNGHGGHFRDVVMLRWPQSDFHMVGFVTGRDTEGIFGDRNRIAVYIPTAPNPMTGIVLMLQEADVTPLDISPEHARTWAGSCGAAMPTHLASAQQVGQGTGDRG
jgi:uncharacterized membrane protein